MGSSYSKKEKEEDELTGSTLNVLTYNVRYDAPETDGENAWKYRNTKVTNILRKYNSDLGGLQEPLSHQMKDFIDFLPEYSFYGVGRDDGRSGGEHVAVYWRKDKFKCIDKGVFWLSETPEVVGSSSWCTSYVRITPWVLLEFSEDKITKDSPDNKSIIESTTVRKRILLMSTHLDCGPVRARVEGAKLIMSKIQEILLKHQEDVACYDDRLLQNPCERTAVLLMGDCNCVEGSDTFRVFKSSKGTKGESSVTLNSAHQVAKQVHGPKGTFTGWIPGYYEEEALVEIDFIFTDSLCTVLSYHVIDDVISIDDKNEIRYLSDHRPVLCNVVV